MRLKDRAALITGAGGGIGEATAYLFAQEGAKVGVQDVNVEAAEKVVAAVKEKGGKAVAIAGDVTKKVNCESMVQSVVSEFGRLDILVNNAGINKDALVRKMTEEQWDDVLRVNLKGTFLMCQAAYEPMSKNSYGRIVNTASIGALGNVGQANYSASKAGVMGLTRTLALEFAKAGICVNCVSPGATDTKMTAGIPDDIRKFIEGKIPFRRFAKPEEIAYMHLFLASDEASYITGQTIFVDGGISVGI
jgi:NAD(P)-dependent dehydrogenase (short-subunit alcohol dehydrogenase family)